MLNQINRLFIKKFIKLFFYLRFTYNILGKRITKEGKQTDRLTCLVVTLVSKDVYGASLYKMFPYCAPAAGSHEIKAVQAEIPG